MLLRPDHDERARQAFVRTFRGHLSGRVMPGSYQIYPARIEPAFRAAHGRPPGDRHEVRELMLGDPYYQFWSTMQGRSQELMWESVIEPTERQLPELIERARKLARRTLGRGRRGTLRLDLALKVPRDHTAADIHLQPGGYHTDFTTDDVAAGAVYDSGINLYMNGALGPENDVMGEVLVAFVREQYPEAQPRRILDLGCAIGSSTLPWGRAFPAAELHAIDVGAPVLRYAHARAQALGVPVRFSQQNAESTDFAYMTDIDLRALTLEAGFASERTVLEDFAARRPGGARAGDGAGNAAVGARSRRGGRQLRGGRNCGCRRLGRARDAGAKNSKGRKIALPAPRFSSQRERAGARRAVLRLVARAAARDWRCARASGHPSRRQSP